MPGFINKLAEIATSSSKRDVCKPVITSLRIQSNIRCRYAHTLVCSKIHNVADSAQAVRFSMTLPETAFVSSFSIEVDGKKYDSYIKEKEEAEKEYTEAVMSGHTAGHVAVSVRDSNKFTVSVNIEAQKIMTFILTYEELLCRRLGVYNHSINLDPGQIIEDFMVRINIEESCNITRLKVPPFEHTSVDSSCGSSEFDEDGDKDQKSPALDKGPYSKDEELGSANSGKETKTQASVSEPVNSLMTIDRATSQSAQVTFCLTPDQQRELAQDGLRGELIVQYDVDRSSQSSHILVNDGYFVHFFCPSELPPMNKHVVFVLDYSASMEGNKMKQVKEAMKKILGDLNKDDVFSIVLFSTYIKVYDPLSPLESKNPSQDDVNEDPLAPLESKDPSQDDVNEEVSSSDAMNDNIKELSPSVIITVTPDNIERAQGYVARIIADGGTNMMDALNKSLEIVKFGQELFFKSNESQYVPTPIIICLTDGIPDQCTYTILNDITRNNADSTVIFSLAFGCDADFDFLKKLSLRNSGYARRIYEGSDAALQLRNFYHEVASPLLLGITFHYQADQVEKTSLTRRNFVNFFQGSEMVVAGHLASEENLTYDISGISHQGTYHFQPQNQCQILEDKNGDKAGFMERLWAYLTIRQLLDEFQSAPEGEQQEEKKKKAIEIALKYSFVTPVTSLVVVKPDDSLGALESEDEAISISDEYEPTLGDRMKDFVHSFMRPKPTGPLELFMCEDQRREYYEAVRYPEEQMVLDCSSNRLRWLICFIATILLITIAVTVALVLLL